MRRRVYVASALHHRDSAHNMAMFLEPWCTVTSTWHEAEDATVAVECALPKSAQLPIAENALAEIRASSHLIWLHGEAEGRCGAAIEYGIAIGIGLCVLCVDVTGGRSWAPSIFGAYGLNVSRDTAVNLITAAKVIL
jgi:hypothetical protein